MKEFDKIIGYESIKIELERIYDTLNNPQKYEDLGVSKINNLIIYGDPGVGKTLMANCFLDAFKDTRTTLTFRRNGNDENFFEKLQKTFQYASKNEPSIILLDDMDKFANNGDELKNAPEFVAIQTLIDDFKDRDIFVIATVNSMMNLPDSLIRKGRFDKEIFVCPPSFEDSILILRHYLKDKKVAKDIDYKFIARILENRSCCEFDTVLNEAGVYAAFDGRDEISMDDIKRACMRVVFDAPEELSTEKRKYARELAYHEAGHAVVSEVLEPGSVNIISIKKFNGEIGGATSIAKDEGYFYNKQLMENRVISILAGKAATEIKLGITDVGATDDIRRAYDIVERFVSGYCSFGFQQIHTFRDRVSNDLMVRKENAIAFELERYYTKAKQIIANNMDFFNKVVEELIKKDTLISHEVQKIKSTCVIERCS